MKSPINQFDLEQNQLKIFHNKFQYTKDEWENIDDSIGTEISIARDSVTQNILGLIFKNFMNKDDIYYKGQKAENDFKNLLIQKNIPCLYIGQGLNFIEKNSKIKYCGENITIKRPDFLVSFPELGNVLIDVKYRSKWKYKDETVFYINYNDIDQLYELRNYMNLPIWLAFKDNTCNDFFICSIKILKEIKDGFFERYPPKSNTFKTKHLRIPNNVLSNFSENNLLKTLNDFQLNDYVTELINFETNISIDKTQLLPEEK